MDIVKFRQLPLLGIVRGIKVDSVSPLIEACIAAGLKTIEFTMNTGHAPAVIREAVKCAHGGLTIGAGTVLSMEDAETALSAGATFLVSPTVVADVMAYCRKNTIPIFPGALTPHEILGAHQAGASMVKVFPVRFFGPEYIHEIRGPFDGIELLACGGITSANLPSYFTHGASAVAFGASVFRHEWLEAHQFSSVERCIHELVDAYKEHVGIKR